MSLAGKLDEVTLPELLQFVSLNAKTGKLTLSRRDAQGVIVFQAGRIIYAATNSVREAFGNILIRRGLIDEATLMQALELHNQPAEERCLGSILIEMGKVQREDLELVMRHQTEVVLLELFQWSGGFFRFEPMEIRDGGEIQVDARDFVVAGGLNAEHLLLELATKLDQQTALLDLPEDAWSSATGSDQAPELAEPPEPPAPLRAIITDLRSPSLRAEITLTIMRYAAQAVSRGVLLVVQRDLLITNGHFGVGRPAADAAPISDLELPLFEPSVFAEVVERKQSFKGELAASARGNARFLGSLGQPLPHEALVVPMIVDDRVAMLLYGDNALEPLPLAELQSLELLMAESGLAMEKQAIEERLKHFERTRRRS